MSTSGTVTSRDGTLIAYELMGVGPPIILVAPALADRAAHAKLAQRLAPHFTVLNYDRRGRGQSTDAASYAVAREVEDLAALVAAAGGSASLFGSSSGAVLALEAAHQLGRLVPGVVLYEPPLIVDDSHPPMPRDLAAEAERLVAAGRRNDAVKLFFHRGMGIPAFFVWLMRWLMPGWWKMAAVAHTIPYDLAVLAGLQEGRPLPADRWSGASARVLVLVGSRSEPFFHAGARALADVLADAEYRPLPGGHHGSAQMSPRAIAEAVVAFLKTSS